MGKRDPQRIGDVLARAASALRAGGVEEPEREAEMLLGGVLGVSRGRVRIARADTLEPAAADEFDSERYGDAVQRLASQILWIAEGNSNEW